MKKFIVLLSILACFTSCKCTNEAPKENQDEPAVEAVDSLGYVERTIGLDRQAMFLKAGQDYRWFETCVLLKDYLDEENDGSFEMVVNVFQAVEERDSVSFDTYVVKFQHVGEEVLEETVHGFWVEDFPMNEENVAVSYQEAYEKLMAVNLPKPHTRQVVLRKQIGPKPANPQWIFGNLREQLYVDAVTGEVRDYNPAFEGLNFGTPLGEWP